MRAQTRMLSVLVIDDQSAIRDVLRRILDEVGRYAVAEASNVAEAISVIAEDPPDAVLLDISMPGSPGFVVIEVLRRMEAGTKILVLSGHHDMKAEIMAMGAHAFLPKTTPSKKILATLEKLLDP